MAESIFFRYIGWAKFFGVQNLHFDSKLFFFLFFSFFSFFFLGGGGGSENLGMKVFWIFLVSLLK